MSSRVVRPETKLLKISGEDWLLVKRRLNHGESSRVFIRGHDADGRPLPLKNGMSKIAMYLIDWSFTNLDGTPIVIRGKTLDEVEAALDSLDPASVFEIHRTILDHEDAVAAELDAEKKTLSGVPASDPDLAIARTCGWRYEWVRDLDSDVYDVLIGELTAAAPARRDDDDQDDDEM